MNVYRPDPMLQEALRYAGRGWHLLPCHPNDKRPLLPKESEPGARDGGLWLATTDEDRLTQWWRSHPGAMIGLRMGTGCGAFALDFDPFTDPNTGEVFDFSALLAEVETIIGEPLPPTLTSQTPRGGRHMLFRVSDGVSLEEITNARGVLPKHVDVRGNGGYIILPPSVRSGPRAKAEGCDGVAYRWIDPDASLAVAPRALIDALKKMGRFAPSARGATTGKPRHSHVAVLVDDERARAARERYGRGALAKIKAEVATTSIKRGSAVFKAAAAAGRLVAARAISEREALASLLDACDANGLTSKDGPHDVEREILRGISVGVADAGDMIKRIEEVERAAQDRAARSASSRRPEPPPFDGSDMLGHGGIDPDWSPAGDGAAPLEPEAGDPGPSIPADDKPKAKGRKRRADGRTRTPARDLIMSTILAAGVVLWHGPDGECFVRYPVGDHWENWPVRGRRFRNWLTARVCDEHDLTPSAQAIEDATRVLEARASAHGEERAPWLRVGRIFEKIYIDLCISDWRAVEVDGSGSRVVEGENLNFIRSAGMRPLPEPEAGYEIDILRQFLNVETDADFVLVVAWLLMALNANGPYPILVFNGEQGTGKSTASRLLGSLVDPSVAAIRAPPKNLDDFAIAFANSHLVAIDNISKIDAEMADAYCRGSSGGSVSARAKFTDRDEVLLTFARPIILNGIPALTERPDLADRSINVRLRVISEEERKPEREFWTEWEEARPKVLGALLDGVSAAIRNLPKTKLATLPRLADFALWATAAESGLGWEPGTFMRAYTANREALSSTTFEADPVATAIRDLIRNEYMSGWSGTATELLDALNLRASESLKRSRLWPVSAQGVGNRIDRIAPLLRQQGFAVDRFHSGSRIISITPVSSTP